MSEAKHIPFTQESLNIMFIEMEPGVLYWRNTGKGRSDISKPAGHRHAGTGYFNIKINYKHYGRHRLVWFMKTGHQPKMLDHIKGKEYGDMISNLQISNSTHNNRKARMPKTNSSGFIGVSWCKTKMRWRASIRVGRNRRVHLGYFRDVVEAGESYARAKKIYHNGLKNIDQ